MTDTYIKIREAIYIWSAHGGEGGAEWLGAAGSERLLQFYCREYRVSAGGTLEQISFGCATVGAYIVDGKTRVRRDDFEEALVKLDRIQALSKEKKKEWDEQIAKETPGVRAAYVAVTKRLEEAMSPVSVDNALKSLMLSLRDGRQKISELTTCLRDKSKAMQTCLESAAVMKVSNEKDAYTYLAEKAALERVTTECTEKSDQVCKLLARIKCFGHRFKVLEDELTEICAKD